VQGRPWAGVAAVGAGPAGVVDPVVAGVHLGVPDQGVGGPGVDLEQAVAEQHPGSDQQRVQAQLAGQGEPAPDPAAAAVVKGRGQGARGGEHHPGHVGGVGGQVGGRDLPAPGVPDQHHPAGADALADGLQVGDLPGDGVPARVLEPGRAAGPHLVVDPDVVAVAGEPAEVGGIPGHVGDAGAAVQEHHRGGPWPAPGGQVDPGDPRPGRQLPGPLAGHRSRGQPRVAEGQQRRDHEGGHADQGPDGEPDPAGPATPVAGQLPGGQGHPGGRGGQVHGQPGGQEHRRPVRHRRHPDQGQQAGHGRDGHDHQQPQDAPKAAPHQPWSAAARAWAVPGPK
jgi:hypothetical protein